MSDLLAPWTVAAAIDGRRWLFGGGGARLFNPLRLPPCWTMADEERTRRLDAGSGDVALVAAALPDDEECTPDRLLAVARDGGRALAEHLARRAQARGSALLAAVLEAVGP